MVVDEGVSKDLDSLRNRINLVRLAEPLKDEDLHDDLRDAQNKLFNIREEDHLGCGVWHISKGRVIGQPK